METKLVVVGGKANRKEIRLKLPATLGRGHDADLTVAHPLVSRLHCRLEEVDGALVLRDNNSTNGTFVGKARITEVVLKPGDQFTVGPLTFKAVYEHAGAFPSLGQPTVEDDATDAFGLPPSAGQDSSDDDFTVAFDPKQAAKAKPSAKPAAAKATTKPKAPPAKTKPAAKSETKPAAKSAGTKPAEKKPAPKAKPEPVQPPAAAVASGDEINTMDWLADDSASAATVEPEPLADLGFDDEPIAAAPAKVLPADEPDALPPPVAAEDAEVLDWLEEPAAAAAPAEPREDLGFDEEPMAVEVPAEAAPAEELDALPPPAAAEDAEVLDWLEEPAAAAAPAEPLADLGFDEEPMAVEVPAEVAPAEELDALPPPAAAEDAEVLDWLEEPAAAAASAEPLADLGFDEEPMAVEVPAEVAPAEELDALPPPAAAEDAEVLDWLEEPAAAAASAEPLADLGFDEEPMAVEVPAEVAPAEELDALPPPAAAEEAEVLDWLEEPAVAAASAEPLADLGFDEEPMVVESPAEAAPAEELDALPPSATAEEAEALDWLEEPPAAAAPVEPLADLGVDEEPMAVESPAEVAPAEEPDALPPPAAAEEAEVLDWLEEPPAAAAPAEPLADIGFDEVPMESAESDEVTLPAADSEDDVFGWLEEPPASEPQAEAESPGEIGIFEGEPVAFDEVPVAAEPLVDLNMAEEPTAAEALPESDDEITLPAADAETDALDWLAGASTRAPQVEPKPLVVFDEEPVAAEPLIEDAAPVEPAELVPPAAEADDHFVDWLDEPEPRAAHSEVESIESLSFDEEPVPAEPLADLSAAEEPVAAEALPESADEIILPAAETDADFTDWLAEPAASASQAEAEPPGDIEFGEVPVAAEPLIEDAAPVEPAEFLAPAAEADDNFIDWLDEPAPRAAHSEVESLESLSFDEEPVPAEPLADLGAAEEPVAAEALPESADEITLPAAETDADFMDWLAEPAPSASQAEAGPPGDIEFGEVPVAAEPLVEDAAPVEPAEFVPPGAEADDNFIDWLDEPEPRAAHSEVESLESLSIDEEPVPAEALPDAAIIEEPPAEPPVAEESELIASPAADADAGVLDWLAEPAAGDVPVEAEPLVDFGFDEAPVAAEPLDAAPATPEAEPITPPLAEEEDMTAFWPGETPGADPQLDDQASDEMDFDFGNEPAPDAALGDLPMPVDEPMFIDEDVAAATPALADEAQDLELNFGAEQEASDFGATEMFVASDEAEQQPVLAEPADFSDDDALDSFGGPAEAFEVAEANEAEEAVEFDFLAGDEPTPAAASEFEVREEPELLTPVPSAERSESAADKPAKKGWWPFGKSKKEKPEKKAKPEPKGRKAAAAKKPEPDPIPLAEVESEPVAPSEEFVAPVAPQDAADAEGVPDFSFADSGHEAPAKSGGDDDLEDFFQDLGLK